MVYVFILCYIMSCCFKSYQLMQGSHTLWIFLLYIISHLIMSCCIVYWNIMTDYIGFRYVVLYCIVSYLVALDYFQLFCKLYLLFYCNILSSSFVLFYIRNFICYVSCSHCIAFLHITVYYFKQYNKMDHDMLYCMYTGIVYTILCCTVLYCTVL